MGQNSKPPGDPDKPQIDLARKAAFMAMLKAVEEESDRDGWVSGDEAIAMVREMLDRKYPL